MAICKLKQLCGRILRREISSMRGNTLIEGGVVMCAVAAVAVITIGGSSIVQRIRLGSVISDVNGFSKAVVAFEAKYSGLPGDSASVTALTGATAGNANGVIDSSEALQFWKQLALSGLIKGKYDGSSANVPGVGVPKGPSENSGYNVLDPTGISLASQTVIIEFSGFNGSANNLAILTPEDAKTIDKKMDDGLPNTGIVRGVDSSGVNSCSSNPTAPTATYSTSAANAKTLGCRLRFIVRASSQADDAATTTGCQPGQSRISLGANGKCPDGTIGKIIETCRFDSSNVGTWFISENHCQAVTCQGGRKAGEKRVLPCNSPAFIGSATIPAGVVQTCSNDGIWVTDAGTGTNGKAVNCIPDTSASCSGFATNEVRAPQACNWGQVGMLSQTCNGSTWATTSNTCTAIPCSSPGGIVGDTIPAEAPMTTSCPSGYSGTYKQTCLADGTWQITSNSCVPTTPATACTVGTTADISLGCPLGETGSNIYRCTGVLGAAGKWAPLQNSCEPITCSGDRIGSVRVVKEAPCPKNGNGVRIEVCEGEYIGDLTVNPPKGKWNPYTDSPTNTVLNTNQCATVMCDGKQDNKGFATWQHTAVGQNASGTVCLPGYSGTVPTRACGANGVWADPVGTCAKNKCSVDNTPSENAIWGTVESKTSDAKGKCQWPDYEGAPTRDCDLTPTVGSAAVWSSGSKGICRPSLLPVKSSNLVLWLDAAETMSLYSDTTCATPIKEGQGVGCWQDKSGNLLHVTQVTPANQPIYTTNASPTGKPTLAFNGSSSVLGKTGVAYSSLTSSNEITIFLVQKNLVTKNSSTIWWASGDNDPRINIHAVGGDGILNFDFGACCATPGTRLGVTPSGFNNVFNIITARRKTDNTQYVYVNGTLLTSGGSYSNAVGGTGTLVIGDVYNSSSFYFQGQLSEVVVYKTGLTDGDRADVEIYLGSKWGIDIAPPVGSMRIWLDGADPSNLFTATNCTGAVSNGSAVGCWKDKSLNQNFTGGASPTYLAGVANGRGIVRFNGTSNYLNANGLIFTPRLPYTFIATLKLNSAVTNNQHILSALYEGIYGEHAFYYGSNGLNGWRAGNVYVSAPGTPDLLPHILTTTYDGTNHKLFIDNVYKASAVSTGSMDNNACCQFVWLGANGNSSWGTHNFLNADFYEMIGYNSALTTSQRMSVDMYLSRKWNIPIPLPPVTSGMTLWLDGDDQGSTFIGTDCLVNSSNGSAVGCWGDKSRVGNNATAGTAPTYVTGAINGRSVTKFNGANTWLATGGLSSPNKISVMAVATTGSISGYKRIIDAEVYSYLGVGGTTNYFSSFYGNGSGWGTVSDHGSGGAMTVGNPYILISIQDGTNDNSFINGTTLPVRANAMTAYSNVSYFMGTVTGGGQWWDGDIAEINIYNRALSTSERCLMESYYGAKWGISTAACSIAATAAVSGGLVLWLDANDSTTLFTSNGCITGQNPSTTAAIGCWKDKSGNLNHATQATSANRPAYTTNIMNNKPVIRFNGSSSYITAPTSVMQSMSAGTATGSTVFLVAKTTVIQNSSIFASYPYTNPGELWFNSHLPFGSGNLIWDNGVCCSGSARINVAWGGSVNTPYVWTFNTDGTISQNVWRNGVNIATKSNSELPSYGNTRYLDFGVIRSGSLYYNGDLAEILIYNRALGSAERQLVESYLGSKWGIVVNPVPQITGLQLWLDASDNSTLFTNSNCLTGGNPVNGNTIGCWKDKSGNSKNVTAGSAPTYATNTLNSLPVLSFNGSNVLTNSSMPDFDRTTIFAVAKYNSGDVDQGLLELSVGGVINTGTLMFHDPNNSDFRGVDSGGLKTAYYYEAYPSTHILTGIVDGSNLYYYIDGVLENTIPAGTLSGNINRVDIGELANQSQYSLLGNIAEVIIYNAALSSSNRQAVEMYLGNKWGITINPPLPSGIQLWLDAADSSTIYNNTNCATGQNPGNGGTINCWRDKSGTNSNAVAGGAAAYTTGIMNGLPVARFNGSSHSFTIANTSMLGSMGSNNTTFIVSSTAAVKAQSILTNGGTLPRFNIHLPWSDGTLFWDYGTSRVSTAWGGATGTAYVWTFNASNNTSQNIWRNGILIATSGTCSSLGYSGYLYIAIDESSRRWGGDIGEILIYNTALSNTERSNVQRYLGAKWGISVP